MGVMPLDPSIEDVFLDNLSRLQRFMEERSYDIVILLSPSNIVYASGLRSPSGAALITRECGPILLAPLLDYERASTLTVRGFDVYGVYRGGEEGIQADIPKNRILQGSLGEAIINLAKKCKAKRVAADLSNASYSVARLVSDRLEAVDIAGDILSLRAVKSNKEVMLIEKAISVAQKAFEIIYTNNIAEGVSEAWLAGLMNAEMMRHHAWGEAFPTIVAFYSNTAYPHHTPTPLLLGRPGPILVDWGAIVDGYRSDMTRTWWYSEGQSAKFRNVVDAVARAQEEAIDSISPGVEAWEPDNAARRVLEKEGLASYFIHGLGHGVGVDIHEEPYLRPGSKKVLEPGMIVTVEPGVYIPGLFGVRIEDMVLVTKSGARVLTSIARILP